MVITSGILVQSIRNWKKWGCLMSVRVDNMGTRTGFSSAYFIVNCSRFFLVWPKEGQNARICSRSSWTWAPLQSGVWHQPCLLVEDQWLQSNSVLYLPDNILACTMATSSQPEMVWRGQGHTTLRVKVPEWGEFLRFKSEFALPIVFHSFLH